MLSKKEHAMFINLRLLVGFMLSCVKHEKNVTSGPNQMFPIGQNMYVKVHVYGTFLILS